MCERSSRVSGSIIANSSSMPRVNLWSFALMAGWNVPHKRENVILSERKSGTLPDLADRLPAASRLSSNLAEQALCYCGLKEFAPAQVVAAGEVFARFTDGHF